LDYEHVSTHSLPSTGTPILPETHILHFLNRNKSVMRISVWEGTDYERMVGCTEIKMSDIANGTITQWHELHAPLNSYVSGSCHIRWKYNQKDQKLNVSLLEAKDLAIAPGSTFCFLSFVEIQPHFVTNFRALCDKSEHL
jgi:hypothetical protein